MTAKDFYDQKALASLAKVFNEPLRAHHEAGMWRLGSLGIPMTFGNTPSEPRDSLRSKLHDYDPSVGPERARSR